MNERIKQLAEQAGVKMNAYGHPIPASLASNFDELAELIVKECASELIRWKDEPFPYDPEFGAKLIKQYFGVA